MKIRLGEVDKLAQISGNGFIEGPPRSGQVIEVIDIPDPAGTGTDNARFGGPDNKTLFITEGFQRVIYKVPVAIAGLPIPISASK